MRDTYAFKYNTMSVIQDYLTNTKFDLTEYSTDFYSMIFQYIYWNQNTANLKKLIQMQKEA